MMKLKKLWETLLYNYFFLPTLMAVIGMGPALGMLTLDRALPSEPWGLWAGSTRVDRMGRALLSTVVGSTISVAGTVFSIVIVAFTLTSSQFGARQLINFMRDTGNKVVLGTFAATFLYCLLLLRTIRGAEDSVFVPHISVTVGIVLAIASVGVLIYFIQHSVRSIQSWQILQETGRDLDSFAEREIPSPYRYDSNNKLRLIVDPVTFAGLTDSALDPIRPYGRGGDSPLARSDHHYC